MRSLHLVRHGRPAVDPAVPACEWPLHPAAAAEVRALAGRLPAIARRFSSTEPKAVQTTRLLTTTSIGFMEGLREAVRPATWFEDRAEFEALVRRAFAEPGRAAYPGWEPLEQTRTRVTSAVRRILDSCPDDDVVLVGHGTAWTLVRAELTGTAPDVDAWRRLQMPDVWTGCLQSGDSPQPPGSR